MHILLTTIYPQARYTYMVGQRCWGVSNIHI